jgi:hypothetical protein
MSVKTQGARLLVAVAEAEETTARLEVAAALAKGLRLELAAVLVEQQALLDLLALPIAKEVTLLGGEIRPLEGAALAQAARRREARLRQRLEGIASGAGLSWSLIHLRLAAGCAELEGLRAAGDILALSPGLAESAQEGPLLILPATGPGPLRKGPLGKGPVAWLSDRAGEAPEAARRIARALDRPLVSLSPAEARGGRYAVSSAPPCLMIARDLEAPLDRPRGLLLLARETSCPALLLGRDGDGGA